MKLRDYQKPYAYGILHELKTFNRVLLEMPTGSGKTFTVTYIITNWLEENPTKKVLFVAHRIELVNQFTKSCKVLTGITPTEIDSDSKKDYIENNSIYSCMVESLDNRLNNNPDYINDVGLLVFDEGHLNLYDRIMDYYPDVKVIGVTATPISSNYQKPLNKIYDQIVTNLTTQNLIDMKFLVRNKTYSITNEVDLSKVKKLGDDYNTKDLMKQYKKSKHIQNVVKAYKEYALGKKTIIFNVNVEHCEMVSKAFNDAFIPSKVLHGEMSKKDRLAVLEWFENTNGAVLQNVGIAVAGYDHPPIECVIFNRDTMSLSLVSIPIRYD